MAAAARKQPVSYMGPEPTEKQLDKAKKALGGATARTLGDWIDMKKIVPSMGTVTPTGDLYSFPASDGHTAEVIPLRGWQVKSPQEIAEFFTERRSSQQVKDAETAFATAKRNLREVTQSYMNDEATKEDVVRANNEVREADIMLNSLIKLPRNMLSLEHMMDRDLTLNVEDVNNVFDPVLAAEYTIFPVEGMYKPAEEARRITVRRAPTAVEAAAAAGGGGGAAAGGGGGGAALATPRQYTQAEGARIGAIRAARAKQQQGGFVHKMQ
jgi:hypothetical protein